MAIPLSADGTLVEGRARSTHPPLSHKSIRDAHPTPAFCKKSPQAIENKGRECEKERQERIRAGNPLKELDLRTRGETQGLAKTAEGGSKRGDTRAFCMDVKTRELRKKGFVSL